VKLAQAFRGTKTILRPRVLLLLLMLIDLSKRLLLQDFSITILCAFLISKPEVASIFHAILILLVLIILIFSKLYRLWSSSLQNFACLEVTLSLLGLSILLSAMFSDALRLLLPLSFRSLGYCITPTFGVKPELYPQQLLFTFRGKQIFTHKENKS
jgi:hypothetical protein